MCSLRNILKIRWQDKVSNLEVLSRANTTSIEAMILQAQLRWTGHVIRMDKTKILRQLLYGEELSQGHRQRGRPHRHYKDLIKANLRHTNIHSKELEAAASDRVRSALTKTAYKSFEERRFQRLQEEREKRHSVAEAALVLTAVFPCPRWPRVCASQVGLYSHLRAHDRKDSCWLHIIVIVGVSRNLRKVLYDILASINATDPCKVYVAKRRISTYNAVVSQWRLVICCQVCVWSTDLSYFTPILLDKYKPHSILHETMFVNGGAPKKAPHKESQKATASPPLWASAKISMTPPSQTTSGVVR